jgi:amyotrophic lateral sclerosis 2 protein
VTSSATSSQICSLYIGSWVADQRRGYGVLDDIAKGEKYMGMWGGDSLRHGRGIMVTIDGIYFEGR